MQPTKVTVSATVAAPIDQVWAYYTQPKHITQWNFANDEWQCPQAETDLRPGGKHSARMEAKDGSFGFDFEAVYDIINPPNQLSYTMADGRQATTLFESTGDATRVTTTFDAETMNDVDMQQQGWQAILNNFKKYAEGK